MNTPKTISTKSSNGSVEKGEPKQSSLPLLYQSLTALSKTDHKKLTYDESPGYLHAATTNALPVLLNEFIMAEKHYPIFFSNLDEPVPLVAVGPHNENRNMFIDGEGKWKRGYHIPAYLVRYPFVLIKAEESSPDGQKEDNSQEKEEKFVLAFDEKAEHITSSKGNDIFAKVNGVALIDTFIDSCRSFAQAGNVTQNFVNALKEHNLLAWQSISRTVASGGESETIFSFVAVNSEVLNKLENSVILDFHKKGWLPLIYSHLASLSNWTRIIQDDY